MAAPTEKCAPSCPKCDGSLNGTHPSVEADTSRPQRDGPELPVEWKPEKSSEFVGGGNLPLRRVPGLSGSSIQLTFVTFRAANIRPYGLRMFYILPF